MFRFLYIKENHGYFAKKLQMFTIFSGYSDDDYNDLCMFDEKFCCVAMGNACDALKEKADYVPSVRSFGFI